MTTTKGAPVKPLPLDLQPTSRRILRTYRALSAAQISDGMGWYQEAHELALELDPTNPLRAAGVIAAFSVRTRWSINQYLARRAYRDRPSGHTGVVLRKVERILDGEDVVTVLNAPKTVNFALTIADPCDPNAVVIDRHAFDIAVGRVTDDETRAVLARKGVYDLFADQYRNAARRIGISPSQMQACTWVGWRETKIRTSAAMRREAGRDAA